MLAVFPALTDGFPGPEHLTPESVSFPEVPPSSLAAPGSANTSSRLVLVLIFPGGHLKPVTDWIKG